MQSLNEMLLKLREDEKRKPFGWPVEGVDVLEQNLTSTLWGKADWYVGDDRKGRVFVWLVTKQ